jgi:hypothetical protein
VAELLLGSRPCYTIPDSTTQVHGVMAVGPVERRARSVFIDRAEPLQRQVSPANPGSTAARRRRT